MKTYHTGLSDGVGEQDQENTQNRSDLDGEAARLALKPQGRGGELQLHRRAKHMLKPLK